MTQLIKTILFPFIQSGCILNHTWPHFTSPGETPQWWVCLYGPEQSNDKRFRRVVNSAEFGQRSWWVTTTLKSLDFFSVQSLLHFIIFCRCLKSGARFLRRLVESRFMSFFSLLMLVQHVSFHAKVGEQTRLLCVVPDISSFVQQGLLLTCQKPKIKKRTEREREREKDQEYLV